jgi:hypothetical protein
MNSSEDPARRSARANSSWDRGVGGEVMRRAYALHAQACASDRLIASRLGLTCPHPLLAGLWNLSSPNVRRLLRHANRCSTRSAPPPIATPSDRQHQQSMIASHTDLSLRADETDGSTIRAKRGIRRHRRDACAVMNAKAEVV